MRERPTRGPGLIVQNPYFYKLRELTDAEAASANTSFRLEPQAFETSVSSDELVLFIDLDSCVQLSYEGRRLRFGNLSEWDGTGSYVVKGAAP